MNDREHKTKEIVLRGGRVVDQLGERKCDVLIRDGLIAAVEKSIEPSSSAYVLDASACIVTPGLVDLHTHLREPGGEAAETVESGARAGALGGYTALLAMPNTTPAIDCAAVVRDVYALGESACAQIGVAGAITAGRAGERLSEMAEMAALGVRIFTDDGSGVQDGGLMRRALEYARDLDVVLAQHCEDHSLARGGHMHEGAWSSRLGIAGQPGLAEEAMLARDLALVELCQTRMHFLHLSTKRSMQLLKDAKEKGLLVTAEVTPHHLSLTDAEVASFDPVFKVNPPLRTDGDVESLRQACKSGTLDAIATDHAPHAPETKEEPFEAAPPGMLGLETALSVCFDALCRDGVDNDQSNNRAMGLVEFFALMSWKPAAIAGLDVAGGQGGSVATGSVAHLCVFDPTAPWVVEPTLTASRSRNTPFAGRQLQGRVRHTIYKGEPVVIDAVAQR